MRSEKYKKKIPDQRRVKRIGEHNTTPQQTTAIHVHNNRFDVQKPPF